MPIVKHFTRRQAEYLKELHNAIVQIDLQESNKSDILDEVCETVTNLSTG